MSELVKVEQEDPSIVARNTVLKIGNKRILTPCRALHLREKKECEAVGVTDLATRGLNEIYRRLKFNTLHKLETDVSYQEQFNASIMNALRKIPWQVELTLLFVEYDSQRQIPADKQIEYLFDLIYNQPTDTLIPPVLRDVSPTAYLDFLNRFFQLADSYNRKPIFGLIPYGSHRDLSMILDFYLSKGVTLFAMDLKGRHPFLVSTQLGMITRKLQETRKEYNQDGYLHGFNTGSGRALRTLEISPAKDILSFYSGFDSFGASHVPLKLTPDLYQRLGTHAKTPPIRFFNRDDYGYYREDIANVKGLFASRGDLASQIDSINKITDMNKKRAFQRILNAREQGVEARNIRQKIQERELKNYLESKSQVKREIKQVIEFGAKMKLTKAL